MKKLEKEFPLQIKISFQKLFNSYRTILDSGNEFAAARAKSVLEIESKYPILSEGLTTEAQLKKYKKQIDLILEGTFSSVLQKNEIKTATIPFQEMVFQSTERYDAIIKNAGKGYETQLMNFDDHNSFIMGCSIILNAYYGFKADFRRPFFYQIPDASGDIRSYKVLFNADFIEVVKTDRAIDITEEDYLELLENFDNVDVWKEKFPPGSWISKGFVIASMYDATTDVAISQFKESLLRDEMKDQNFIDEFQSIIQTIFNLPNIKVGYTVFNEEDASFERVPDVFNINSYILNKEKGEASSVALCSHSYSALFEKHESYCVTDVNKYNTLYPKNTLYKKLHNQNIQSAIITSIITDGKVAGILEIVSENPHDLNTVNANKLKDIMPFLEDSVRRSNEKIANELELIIQNECTSIHPSVHWKFKKEAKRFHQAEMERESTSFREVTFQKVFPLYGQIDIKGSSEARNTATQQDLIIELEMVQQIIFGINEIEPLPIYEQIGFRISTFLAELNEQLQVDSEVNVKRFLKKEILPLFKHLRKKNGTLRKLVDAYSDIVDGEKGIVYKNRRGYDESVMLINKTMAAILDDKQYTAQQMYPHYFERFKTDGVEHSLYIGESITKEKSFNKIYLYNLRLWQLQAMCEMENSFYKLKENLPMPLDVASMILVFGSSLSLRFRLDEKRFDVDGTYNARYEVVKKRVDKANIKGTKERITQAGKISIIYSQKQDEIEYLKYVRFLQFKKQLGDEVEIVDLDDLQGVTGLKAIRVNVLYNKGSKDKSYYTYKDLMAELDA